MSRPRTSTPSRRSASWRSSSPSTRSASRCSSRPMTRAGRALRQARAAPGRRADRVSAWLRQHRARALAGRASWRPERLVIGIALSLPAGGLRAARKPAPRPAPACARAAGLAVPRAAGAKRADAEALGTPARRPAHRQGALRAARGGAEGHERGAGAAGGHRRARPQSAARCLRRPSRQDIAGELGKLPGVAHVQADAVWARRLAAAGAIAQLGIGSGGAARRGLVAVTFNTIRLQILTQRDEIEVSKLIGATDAFIGRPFYYLGLLQGSSVECLPWVSWPAPAHSSTAKSACSPNPMGRTFRFAFLPLPRRVWWWSWPGCSGWLGAQLSVGRHLRAIEPM